MGVTVKIEVEPETAAALQDPRRRQAVGKLIDRMVRPVSDDSPLTKLLETTRAAARAIGLTDADIDAELQQYRAEQRS
jgi:hypothetical protein